MPTVVSLSHFLFRNFFQGRDCFGMMCDFKPCFREITQECLLFPSNLGLTFTLREITCMWFPALMCYHVQLQEWLQSNHEKRGNI